ncbi:MAG: hypothetical protein JXM73_04570 [Anaerolineae bacterium]|nr:hypothetical protein [Anaerolineae bacterium]
MRRIVLFVLSAVVLAGCTAGTTPVPAPPAADPTGGVAILFQRSGGLLPSDLQWAVYPDGRVVTGRGEEKSVSSSQVQALLAEISGLGFFEFEDSYGLSAVCNDCYTYSITVNDGGRVKNMVAVDGAADTPDTVLEIVDAINTFLSELP